MKKILILLLFIFSLFNAYSLTNDNYLVYHFTGDNTSNDASGNNNHATWVGSATYTTGNDGSAFQLDGTTQAIDTNHQDYYDQTTMSYWVKTTNTALKVMGVFDGANKLDQYYFNSGGVDGRLQHILRSSAGNDIFAHCTDASVNDGNWHHIVFIFNFDDDTMRCYVDGTNLTVTYSNSGNAVAFNMGYDYYYGARNNAGSTDGYMQQDIDDISLWNRSLSDSEVTDLYNNGIEYASPTPTISINISDNDYFSSSPINVSMSTTSDVNMSIYINSVLNQTFNNINSTSALINLNEGENNLSFKSVDANGEAYNNVTVYLDTISPNITRIDSNNQNFLVDFSTIFNVTDALSGIASCTINATYLENVTNSSQYNKFINCTDSTTFGAVGEYNLTIIATDNVSNTQTLLTNLTIQSFVSVNFFDGNSSQITNYSYTLYYPSGIIERINNINNSINLSTYHNGSLDIGNYIIQFNKTGYTLQNVTIPMNETSGGTEYNFTILDANIIINLYNDNTKTLITNESFSLQLSGSSGYTFSSNGTLFNITSFVIAGDYVGLISSTNYESKEIYFTYNTQELKEIDVYFIPLNLTNLGFVTIEAYNSDNTPYKYISTYAKQWFADQSSFIKVQETRTGNDGTAELKIILEDYIYQFCIYTSTGGETCTGDEIIKTTENGQVIPITEERRVTTVTSYSELLDFSENISVYSSNVTGFRNLYVNFDWIDLTGFNLNMCYEIYKDYAYTKTLVEENCVVGSAGTFEQIYLLNSTYAYIVSVTATIDNAYLPMYYNIFKSGEASSTFEGTLQDKGMKSLGIVLYIVIFMTIVALLKNPFHAVVAGFILILGANYIFAGLLSPYAISALLTFCGMTAWGLRQIK